MVTIQGLPATTVNRAQKAKKRGGVNKQQDKTGGAQATKVAEAVSHSIRHADAAEIHKAQIQYDLPEGSSRRALEEYMQVLNRAKKEELAQLVGVDIYI